jgi:hypothetical protein
MKKPGLPAAVAEALSFSPFLLNRPYYISPERPHKSVTDLLRQNLRLDNFSYLVYTFSETRFIEQNHKPLQPNTESIEKLVVEFENSPDRQIDILISLNYVVLSIGIDKSLPLFKAGGVPSLLPSWFIPDPDSTRRKPLLLNLLALTTEFLNIDLHSLFAKVAASFIGTKGFLAKKHILVLFRILAILSNLDEIERPHLTSTYGNHPQPVLEEEDVPHHIKFLASGHLPPSYLKADGLMRQYVTDQDYLDFVSTSEYRSDSKFAPGRAFLVAIAPLLHKFLAALTASCQSSSRALYAHADFDLGYPAADEASGKSDAETDRDVIVFACWGIIYAMMELLEKSNVMDREVLKYFICRASLPGIALQSFVADLRPALSGQPLSNYLAHQKSNPRRKILAAAIAVGLHAATDVIAHSFGTLQQLVSETVLSNILTVSEMSGSKPIMHEAAYALSHFLRFISADPKLLPMFVTFVYLNLSEFEMVETWAPALKPQMSADTKPLLQFLQDHCTKCGMQQLFSQ